MDKDKEDESPIPHTSMGPDNAPAARKRKNMTPSSQREKEKTSGSRQPELSLPNIRDAFVGVAPSHDDSIQFISTMSQGGYSWDTGEPVEEDEEAEMLLFQGFRVSGMTQSEPPEALFDGVSRRGVRKVIIDNRVPLRVSVGSSDEEWTCHKCDAAFPAVQMLWTHIDSCEETQPGRRRKMTMGLPPVPTMSEFVSGGYKGDYEEGLRQQDIEAVPRSRYQPRWVPGQGWGEEEEDENLMVGDPTFNKMEYAPQGISFEQHMEAAIRASQNLILEDDDDANAKFEEDTLRAIEMSVSGISPEQMSLIELHREIDDMAVATTASLQTIPMKEFDCGWTRWDSMFKKRRLPTFRVDHEPKHTFLWDVLKVMHMCGWLNTTCPKCFKTRHGGSCIHFRPCDLKVLFNMRRVCFSWMCIIDAWMADFRIRKVVFTCTRCRVLGSEGKDTHLSQYYYTEKWEKTKIKLVNNYEMPNEEFRCEFGEGSH